MAKKQEKEIVVEDAVIVEDEVIVETEINLNLPVIVKKFFIEDKKSKELKEYSLDAVAQIEKDADEIIKGIKDFNDVKSYEALEAKKQEALKQRTLLEAKRKEVTKPLNAWKSALDANTKEIGDAAQKVQDKIEAEIKKREDHEAELERERLAKIQERTNTRMERLRVLDGSFDPLNETYSFEYTGTVINKLQLDEFDDEEWEETVNDLFIQHTAEQDKIKADKEKADKEAAELKEAQDKLSDKQIRLRTKELNLNGAEFKDNAWWINGISFSPVQLKDLTDDEWDKRIEDATTVVEEPQVDSNATDRDQGSGIKVGDIIGSGRVIRVDTFSSGMNTDTDSSTLPDTEYLSAENIEDPNEKIEGIEDPLAEVIANNVQAHEDHQAEVDGLVVAEIEFTEDNPFIDFHIAGTSRMRIFPIEYESDAVDLPDKNNAVLNTGQVGNENLLFLIYKLPKQ